MAHGIIKEVDRGCVGFVETFGQTWHRFEEYQMINGPVPTEVAAAMLNYEVAKVPMSFCLNPLTNSPLANKKVEFLLEKFPGLYPLNSTPVCTSATEANSDDDGLMYALVRTDKNRAVFNKSVSETFEVVPNGVFLDYVNSSLLTPYPNLKIESCGTLWGGRIAFVNILFNEVTVKQDDSKNVVRLMYYNAFGGKAISACMHSTRIVCNNTLNIAEAQGAANDTLRKFRHTSGAHERVVAHMIDISGLNKHFEVHQQQLQELADTSMNVRDVSCYLGNLFPIKKDDTSTMKTHRENLRSAVLSRFETSCDLQGRIKGTRYAMLQATTAYNQHDSVSKSHDKASLWFDLSTGSNSTRSFLNRRGWNLLTQKDIPELV